MFLKSIMRTLIVVFVLFVTISVTNAQAPNASKFWIFVGDDFDPADSATMIFGNVVGATYGLDSALGEAEGPPKGNVFEARWVDNPYHTVKLFGNGMLPIKPNYYGVSENPTAQVDTFGLFLANGDSGTGSATFKLRWPSAAYLGARCTAMILNDPTGSVPDIDMFAQDSLEIPNYMTYFGVQPWLIIKTGVTLVDLGVKLEKNTMPASFALRQNYPNPFNPTTTIRFDILKRSIAEVSVFNLLGQKVATLVADELSPGTYSTTWNGMNSRGQSVSSGVYFVRMVARTADNSRQEQFSALQKVLLMK